MAQKKQDLFQWNRRIDPLDVGRYGKKKGGSINDWIKRVQDASEDAIQDVFDGELLGTSTLKEIIPDDEAVYEAQELVDSWMRETSLTNIQKELEYKNENWASTTGLLLHDDIRPDYNDNNMLDGLYKKYLCDGRSDDNIDNSDEGIVMGNNKNDFPSKNSEFYDQVFSLGDIEENDDINDALLVQDVLHGMLTKDFTKNIDLGMKPLAKRAKNPVPRMDIRHEEVKLKGEKRRRNNLEEKKKKLTKEEISQKARDRIMLEERQRIKKEKAEENAILSEMEKIKLELVEEKQRKEEEIKRKKNTLAEARLHMQIELRKEREEEMRIRKEKEALKYQVKKEMEEEALHELRTRMKILHKYFSTWYKAVLEQHLKMGKAQAVAEWKCKMRAWNAWRAYINCVKSSKEAKAIQQAMKEKYRKEQMAICHCNKTISHKCFQSWLKYSRYKGEKARLKLEHKETTRKMALFLEAASKGDLRENKYPEECGKSLKSNPHIDLESVESGNKVNEINRRHTVGKKTHSVNLINDTSDMLPVEIQDYQSKDKSTSKQIVCKNNKNLMRSMAKTYDGNFQTIPGGGNLKEGNEGTCRKDDPRIQTKDETKEWAERCKGMKISKRSENEKLVDMEGPLSTDRSNLSYVSSEGSTLISRKPKVRSDKQATKPLHLAMEERQKERAKRRAAIEEERKKKDQERLEELQAKEAERLIHEQLQKEEELKKRQEQRKMEALRQKEKELKIEQFRLKNTIAKDHYEKVLLLKYGIEPFMRLVQIAKLNIQISDKYRNSLLIKICFVEWHVYVKNVSSIKIEKAEQCYQRILLRRTFHSWLKCRFHLQNMNKIARNFSISLTLKRAFNAWQDYVTDERILMWAKESNAEEHDTMRIMIRCFKAWVKYVKLEKEERERENRKEEFRKKVQTWLPDYKGVVEISIT